MLARRVAAVRLQDHRNGGKPVTLLVLDRGTDLHEIGHPVAGLGFGRPHDCIHPRSGAHLVQPLGRFDSALQTGAVKSPLEVFRPQLTKHGDYPVTPKIRRVGHRRAPVPLYAPGTLFEQVGVLQDEPLQVVGPVQPNRFDDLAGLLEPRPAAHAIASGGDQLSVGQGSILRKDLARMQIP